jgi:hypothetical protein
MAGLILSFVLTVTEPGLDCLFETGFKGSLLGSEQAAYLLEQGGAQKDCDPLPRP